ncbi:UNVERIFIED_CONTAM: hypothetical protein GTU68_013719 [Idotea baltica]|nr:hypothetical protein [Idotea baltica]
MKLYDQGQRIFAENRIAELIEKSAALPKDIQWHFIGHLQRKRVKSVIHIVDLIHAVDRVDLLDEIQKRSKANSCVTRCLLQLKIAQEESKYGFNYDELMALIESSALQTNYDHIRFDGLMGMATFTENQDLIRSEFKLLKQAYISCQSKLSDTTPFNTLSMGMSGDHIIALEEGSTMLRIGSLLF